MRTNIIAIFLLVVATALSAIYWKVDHDFFNEKLLWNEAQSRSELSALTRSVQSEVEGFSQVLDLTVPSLKNLKKDYDHDQVYSHFQMIASVAEQNGTISLEQKYFLEGSSVKSWASTYVPLKLQELRTSNAGPMGQNVLLTIMDPQRKVWILLFTTSPVTQKQYAAILSPDALQGIIDRQKGQMATVSILNHRAEVLGHEKPEYIGKVLKDEPLAIEFLKSSNASGSGIFDSQGERIQGFYEQVETSNLVVTVETPLRTLMMDRSKIKTKFIFMGIGISLLGIAMLMLLGVGSPAAKEAHAEIVETVKESKKAPEPAAAAHVPIPLALAATANPTPPSAPEAPMPTELPAVPVGPAGQASDKKFSELFSEKKMTETFEMIDQLDGPPPPPPVEELEPIAEAPAPIVPEVKAKPKAKPKPSPSVASAVVDPDDIFSIAAAALTKTELIDSGEAPPVDAGTKTALIDSGTKTALIEQGTKTSLIEQGTKTALIEPGTKTTKIEAGTKTTKIDPGTGTLKLDALTKTELIEEMVLEPEPELELESQVEIEVEEEVPSDSSVQIESSIQNVETPEGFSVEDLEVGAADEEVDLEAPTSVGIVVDDHTTMARFRNTTTTRVKTSVDDDATMPRFSDTSLTQAPMHMDDHTTLARFADTALTKVPAHDDVTMPRIRVNPIEQESAIDEIEVDIRRPTKSPQGPGRSGGRS